jgi:hypothetical protein
MTKLPEPLRVLVPLLTICLSAVSLSAQQPALERGSALISGQASVTVQDTGVEENTTTFALTPYVQYFFATGLAIGGELQFSRTSQGDRTFTTYGIGPAISYYFVRPSDVQPFVRGSIRLAHAKSTTGSLGDSRNLVGFRGAAGLLILLSDAVGLDLSLYYDRLQHRDGIDLDVDTFGLAVGVSAFLH